MSVLAHDNAMKRVIQAGAKPVTALSTMLEWQRDWAHRDGRVTVVENPTGGRSAGLNLAVAAGILLYAMKS